MKNDRSPSGATIRNSPICVCSHMILRQIPAAGIDHRLLVLAEAVEEIEHGIAARFVGVVAWRQQDAVLDMAVREACWGRSGIRLAGKRAQAMHWRIRATSISNSHSREQLPHASLLISQGLHGIETCGARGGIQARRMLTPIENMIAVTTIHHGTAVTLMEGRSRRAR